MAKPTTIDEYLDSTPVAGRALLEQLRVVCRTAAPAALEQIKWGYPAYVHADGVILFMFSAHKAHASFAATPSALSAFRPRLDRYRTTKGTITLPYGTPLPGDLLTEIIHHRLHEYEHDDIKWM